MEKQIAVFDVCGTLYDSNTTFDFIRFYKSSSLYVKFIDSLVMRCFSALLGKLFSVELHRMLMLRSLRGYTHKELVSAAGLFYDKCLEAKKIDPVHNLLKKYMQDERFDVYLCSASLDVIVQVISEKLGDIKYFSSKLEFSRDRCLGRIKDDLLGKKQELFSEIDFIATDNLCDYLLILKSKECYIVSKAKNCKRWDEKSIKVSLVS